MKVKIGKSRAVSTVFGTVLFLILFFTVCSTLFIGIFQFNEDAEQADTNEDARSHERIVLTNIIMSGNDIVGLNITNSGSTTIQVKGFYVNDIIVCDPSTSELNINGAYINRDDSAIINVIPVVFDPNDRITVSTARGVKAIELESKFIIGSNSTIAPPDTFYGPLKLNFTLFYHREVDSAGKPLGPWLEGTTIPASMPYCAFKITVTNVDTRTITLSKYCSLTLVTNEGGHQFPWYTNYPGQIIVPGQTTTIVFIWSEPLPSTSAEGFQGFSSATAKVFLTMYGQFSDGTVYGQTIPFEAILRV